MAKRHPSGDPFDEWREIQDHRYDPGHWLGGNIDPIYRRRRNGNPSGYLLIVSGAFALGGGVASLHEHVWGGLHGILVVLVGALVVIAGIRLLAKTKSGA